MTSFRSLVVVALLAVGACSVAQPRDEDSPNYRVPPGSIVLLHTPLDVAEGQARVFLQDGRVTAKTRLNQYLPHCDFELWTVSDGTARIEPDRFVVTEVRVGDEGVVMRRWLHYAGWRMSGDDNTPSMVSRFVDHRLRSARQPQVMRLTCHGGFDFPGRALLPTVAQIRHALGKVATLELAAPPVAGD